MGILNVTPDSFSDGGEHSGAAAAVAHAQAMAAEGADMIDVGGESTRPGAEPVTEDEQLERVLPVIAGIRASAGRAAELAISIDTRSARVAEAALGAGADLVNDVSAGSDPSMFELVARHGVPVCLMHMQGTPETMQDDPSYEDAVGEISSYLLERAAAAQAAGVDRASIVIDPGIGFGKTRAHNLALVRHLDRFVATGYPVLMGASRKRFMGAICAETVFRELVGATCATTALGVAAGVRLFRVHDIKPNRQAADVAWAVGSDQR
ncbi:MAG: dihydropteroate synthase [Gammaproteobacteria bacterium]|nr:dihydropteroate synthase [Gammaproteobacteria bacterium]NNM00833.1 dihydropteroate synthase [Gammaproteobacteria bacterium]